MASPQQPSPHGPRLNVLEERSQSSGCQPCWEQEDTSPAGAAQHLPSSPQLCQKHLAQGQIDRALRHDAIPARRRKLWPFIHALQSTKQNKNNESNTHTHTKSISKIINFHHHLCQFSSELLAFKLWDVSRDMERKKKKKKKECLHFVLNQGLASSFSSPSQFCSRWCPRAPKCLSPSPRCLPLSTLLSSVSLVLHPPVRRKRVQSIHPDSLPDLDGQLEVFNPTGTGF